VAEARRQYFEETGAISPLLRRRHRCTITTSPGPWPRRGFPDAGRYFARFDESPTNKSLGGSL
jgi:hypothetical protein